MDLGNMLNFNGLIVGLWATAGAVAAAPIIYSYYREKHPLKFKATEEIFIDPRRFNPKSEFEKFMNSFGYQKRKNIPNRGFGTQYAFSPWPNPNPNTILGRFASRNNYFKSRE